MAATTATTPTTASPDPAGTSNISDEALLEELKKRGLLPKEAVAPVTRVRSPVSRAGTQMSRVESPVGLRRQRSAESRFSAAEGPNLLEPGPRDGPLSPQLVTPAGQQSLFRILETGGLRGSVEYSWEKVETAEEAEGHPHHGRHNLRVGKLRGTMAEFFGRKSVHVNGRGGVEVFKLQDSAASWNPMHLKTSFRILPAGTDNCEEAYFTVNRDVIGRGMMGLREQWRVFRHRHRDGELVYYCIGSTWGWEYHFYRSQKDHDDGKDAVATLTQAAHTGLRCGDTGVWLPAEFDLSVGPGEDASLLLAVATILDVVHERSQPPSVV